MKTLRGENGRTKPEVPLRFFVFILFLLLVLTIIGRTLFHPVMIAGESMEPTFQSGNFILADDDFTRSDITIGTILVFRAPDQPDKKNTYYVKRVVGTPGDYIEITDGILYRNGSQIDEPYETMQTTGVKCLVGAGEYYVLGDNRNHSKDSRVFGAVSYDEILYIYERK